MCNCDNKDTPKERKPQINTSIDTPDTPGTSDSENIRGVEDVNDINDINDINDLQKEIKLYQSKNRAHLADDWFGKHNFFSRLIMVSVVFVFIYTFVGGLAIGYATVISWLIFAIFATITFGINSLKLVTDFIAKIKK
jgi:hypothetical protein